MRELQSAANGTPVTLIGWSLGGVIVGLLKPVDDFQLSTKHSFLKELTPTDKAALLRFRSNIGTLRGDGLVKKTYREFPQYTLRSKIADKHLLLKN